MNISMLDYQSDWTNLSEQIAKMMMNSDVMVQNERIEVSVLLMGYLKMNHEYEGLLTQISKMIGEKLSIISYSFTMLSKSMEADFVILLTNPLARDYLPFIQKYFKDALANKSTGIFVLTKKNSAYLIKSLYAGLSSYGYFNVYILNKNQADFYLYRTSIIDSKAINLRKLNISTTDKFESIKDVLDVDSKRVVNIFTYDSYPESYVENDTVKGVDGYLISEFTKRINGSYKILYSDRSHPSYDLIYKSILGAVDVCLCTDILFNVNNIDTLWINQMDGTCLIVPRNIPVSSYENIALPMDKTTAILALISTLLVPICWKFISIYSKNRLTTLEMLFTVYQLILYMGASGLERLNRKEKILIYSFIFGSFIMINLYESTILSFMLTDSSLRSAKCIEELNSTNTMFYTYFDKQTALKSKVPFIREDLIFHKVHLGISFSLQLPEQIDENMVYTVSCRFAESFIKSSNNYRGKKRLFDIIALSQSYQHYSLSTKFFYREEFAKFVSWSTESGVQSYWTKKTLEKFPNGQSLLNVDDFETSRNYIEFQDMYLPIAVLLIGSIISLIAFLTEYCENHFISKCFQCRLNESSDKKPVRSKVNLVKWRKKYLKSQPKFRKEGLTIDGHLATRQDVHKAIMEAKRENLQILKNKEGIIKEGYFVTKRMKQNRKIKIIKPVSLEVDESAV